MSNVNTTSLESLRSRFRANGGPANLSRDEQSRLLNHAAAMELTVTEVHTLRTAYQLGGKQLITE